MRARKDQCRNPRFSNCFFPCGTREVARGSQKCPCRSLRFSNYFSSCGTLEIQPAKIINLQQICRLPMHDFIGKDHHAQIQIFKAAGSLKIHLRVWFDCKGETQANPMQGKECCIKITLPFATCIACADLMT